MKAADKEEAEDTDTPTLLPPETLKGGEAAAQSGGGGQSAGPRPAGSEPKCVSVPETTQNKPPRSLPTTLWSYWSHLKPYLKTRGPGLVQA